MSTQPETIKCNCPKCGCLFQLAARREGSTINCPKCKEQIVVVANQPHPDPPKDAVCRCQKCRHYYKIPTSQVGLTAKCPSCLEETLVEPLAPNELVFRCLQCNLLIESNSSSIGRVATCKRCKFVMPVVAEAPTFRELLEAHQFAQIQSLERARSRTRLVGWFMILSSVLPGMAAGAAAATPLTYVPAAIGGLVATWLFFTGVSKACS